MKITTIFDGLSLTSMFAAIAGAAGVHWGVLLAVAVIMIVCATVRAVVSYLMPQASPDRLQLWTRVIERRVTTHRRCAELTAGATRALPGPHDGQQQEVLDGVQERER